MALAALALMAIALLARFAVGNRLIFAACLTWLILGLGAGANLARTIADNSCTSCSYYRHRDQDDVASEAVCYDHCKDC